MPKKEDAALRLNRPRRSILEEAVWQERRSRPTPFEKLEQQLSMSDQLFKSPEMMGETYSQMYARLEKELGGKPMMPAYAYEARKLEEDKKAYQDKLIRDYIEYYPDHLEGKGK